MKGVHIAVCSEGRLNKPKHRSVCSEGRGLHISESANIEQHMTVCSEERVTPMRKCEKGSAHSILLRSVGYIDEKV